MKTYCQKCGSSYDIRPNFCAKCGNSFGAKASFIKPKVPAVAVIVHDEDAEDDIDTNLAFSAEKLVVEIEQYKQESYKIENLMGSSLSSSEKMERSVGESYSLEDFKREAGSIRNK